MSKEHLRELMKSVATDGDATRRAFASAAAEVLTQGFACAEAMRADVRELAALSRTGLSATARAFEALTAHARTPTPRRVSALSVSDRAGLLRWALAVNEAARVELKAAPVLDLFNFVPLEGLDALDLSDPLGLALVRFMQATARESGARAASHLALTSLINSLTRDASTAEAYQADALATAEDLPVIG
jgi:hypothetical protein